MTVLSQFSTEDLEQEIRIRKKSIIDQEIQVVYDAIAAAERLARKHEVNLTLQLGTGIELLYNPREEDWYSM